MFEYEPLPSPLPDDFHCEPTLESIRTTIFETSCSWDTCHSSNGAAWGLKLVVDLETVRDKLVSHDAGSCMGWKLVEPGAPGDSFLWNKLAQKQPACGDRMPWGYEPLPDAALECIREWIRSL